MNKNELLLRLDFMFNSEHDKRILTLEEIKYVKELVERATPMKVIKRNRNYCPKCDGIITLDTDRSFCNNLYKSKPCGQALSWLK